MYNGKSVVHRCVCVDVNTAGKKRQKILSLPPYILGVSQTLNRINS